MTRATRTALLCLVLVSPAGCSEPESERLRGTTIPTYDKTTGKLVEVTFDADKNGVIDTWTDMDGRRPVLTRIDRNEDGRIDRWEHYGPDGALVKVGYSRGDTGVADAWAFEGPDGRIARIEISSSGDEKRIDRWEFHDASGLARAEDDADGNGSVDKWETYQDGALRTAAFDENGDGKPDRRFTYEDGALVLIESEPDATGGYTKRVAVKGGTPDVS
jgi:hypothetical protein